MLSILNPVRVVEMLTAYRNVVWKTVESKDYVSFIFHLMWLDKPERLDALRTLMRR